MRFKLWLEQLNQLPPIPQGFQRLTHFTNRRTAELLLSGEDFKATNGLSSTTDVFSNNDEVWDTIQTGKTGAFSRSEFGDTVVLLDMSPQEYRMRVNFLIDGDVPNDRIVGFVDTNTQRFIPNRNYSPNQVQPTANVPTGPTRGFRRPGSPPVAGPQSPSPTPSPVNPSSSPGIEVW